MATVPWGPLKALIERFDEHNFGQAEIQRLLENWDLVQGIALGAKVSFVPLEDEWFTFVTTDLSIEELRGRNPDLFYPMGSEPFRGSWATSVPSRKRRQLSIRLSAVPGSLRMTGATQEKLLHRGEFVPSPRDLVDGVIQYFQRTGNKSFTDYWVRARGGMRGYVDLQWRVQGLCLDPDSGEPPFSDVGLAVARSD